MKRARRQLKPWVYGAIFLALLLLVLLVVLMSGGFGATITTDTKVMQKKVAMVVARDEITATSESYGKIAFNAQEGQAIGAGEKVARVYKWGYNDNVLQDLNTLEQKINRYQNNVLLADIVDRELEGINASIDQKEQEIAACVTDANQLDLLQLKNELNVLLQSRAEYLKTTVQPDEALQEMYAQREEYLVSLDTWKRDVLSTGEGLISFYFDGYEVLVNKQMIEQLQPKDITNIIAGKTIANARIRNPDERPIYRLVNPNEFYVLLTTKKSDMERLSLGETYSITFDGFFDKTYQGECLLSTRNESGGIYALRVSDSVDEILNTRTIRGTVSATFTGMCADTKAVVTTDQGEDGLYVQIGDEKRFVPIQILYMDKKKTLFKTQDPAVVPGMRYVKN